MAATADGGVVPTPERVAIFVDFWNYELSTKDVDTNYKTDWPKMAQVIYAEAATLLAPAHGTHFCGMFVIGSYHPQTETRLHRWASNILPSFPGITTTFVPRRPQVSGPKCPSCHDAVNTCPACGGTMLGVKEKGVDTLLATDMIRLAWEGIYDSAVLITADEDLAPVVRFLSAKGKKILHGKFPPRGAVLTPICWAPINIPALMPRFAR